MHTYFNIHTHHPTGRLSTLEIENLRFGTVASGQTPCCSAGLHPWFLEETTLQAARGWLEAQAVRSETCAIGEAGLDKVCDTSWHLQEKAFHDCIDVSESVHKPLIIHCVKAYNEILQIKKQRKPMQPWIFHGFNKHPDTAKMLLDSGCFLSFGIALFQSGNHSPEALRITPDDRFFLETDDVAGLDIEKIYERAAWIRKVPVAALVERIRLNVVQMGLYHP